MPLLEDKRRKLAREMTHETRAKMPRRELNQLGLDIAAAGTSLVPFVGTGAGLLSDAYRYSGPEEPTAFDYTMTGASVLPGAALLTRGSRIGRSARALMRELKGGRQALGPALGGEAQWKRFSPAERQWLAKGDAHIMFDKNGKIFGAPPGLDSIEALAAKRKEMESSLKKMLEKPWAKDVPSWYRRSRYAVEQLTPDPRHQSRAARGQGLYSPSTPVPANSERMIGANQQVALTGTAPRNFGMKKTQDAPFVEEFQTGVPAEMGPKTGGFAGSHDPVNPDPDYSTNDIWVGRWLGYTGDGKDAGAEFDRGFSVTEHAFVQGEMQRLTEKANRLKWGGRNDWNVEELQAIPWVETKARTEMARRPGLTYEQAIDEGQVSLLESLPRTTAEKVTDTVPAADSGHLAGLADDPELAARHQELSGFIDPETGRSVLGGNIEGNFELPATRAGDKVVQRPQIARQYTEGRRINKRGAEEGIPLPEGVRMDPRVKQAQKVLSGAEGLLGGKAEMGGGILFPKTSSIPARAVNAFGVSRDVPMGAEDLDRLRTGPFNEVLNLGGGRAVLTGADFSDPVLLGTGKIAKRNKAPYSPVKAFRSPDQAAKRLPLAEGETAVPGKWEEFSARLPWSPEQGTGQTTQAFLDLLDEDPQISSHLLRSLDAHGRTPVLTGRLNRADKWAEAQGAGERRLDLEKLRDMVGAMGWERFVAYVKKNGTKGLPALLIPPGIGAIQEEEQPLY